MRLGFQGTFEAGDSFLTEGAPTFVVGGHEADPLELFVDAWNRGLFPVRRSGHWTASTDAIVRTVEANDRHVTFNVDILVDVRGRLGYVTPVEARGIFDIETNAFSTVVFDFGKTVRQEPEGGWADVPNPAELAVAVRGTVITIDEVSGLQAEWTGLEGIWYLGPPGSSTHRERGR